MSNVAKSIYNCRLSNIETMYHQILNQKFYKLSFYQTSVIRQNFPNKVIPEYVDLTNINHLWLLMGSKVRLYLSDTLNLKKYINELKDLINSSIILVSNILQNNTSYLSGELEINLIVLDSLNSSYTQLLDKFERCYVIVDEILITVNIYRNYFTLHENVNKMNNDYRKIVANDWFYYIFYVYEKYGGKYPTTSEGLFELLKMRYPDMIDLHASELISIIDTYLGGIAAKNVSDIAKNLESWINRNYDCVGNYVTNKILFTNVIEVI
jgi:hypothetical protein